ncbi:molybdopterin molybdotransferase MoeA [Saccharibacter floricola]|nr:molybdopterin-binding protein [Saccharibacter floricola]
MALITVTEAHKAVMRHAGDFGCEPVPLHRARGRVLRQKVRAERDQPPYDRVMMDGIALRVGAAFPLHVLGMQRAGEPPRELPEGAFCWEVTTGSVLPIGANCIIPVEQIRRVDDQVFFMGDELPAQGAFIHPQASDRTQGDVLLCEGQKLDGPSLAVLAANGVATPLVSREPSVCVVTTGDELVEVDEPVQPWQVRRSNYYAIMGMLQLHGFSMLEHRTLKDAYDETCAVLGDIIARYDVVLLSGGVSMGAFDYVPRALEHIGVQCVFYKVLQRPGGPLWFGYGSAGQRVVGLPGNPVSAMVCMARYVLPLLDQAAKRAVGEVVSLSLTAPVPRLAQRTRFVPVQVRGGEAQPFPMPTSGDFMGLPQTGGIVELSPGEGEAFAGTRVPFYPWA